MKNPFCTSDSFWTMRPSANYNNCKKLQIKGYKLGKREKIREMEKDLGWIEMRRGKHLNVEGEKVSLCYKPRVCDLIPSPPSQPSSFSALIFTMKRARLESFCPFSAPLANKGEYGTLSQSKWRMRSSIEVTHFVNFIFISLVSFHLHLFSESYFFLQSISSSSSSSSSSRSLCSSLFLSMFLSFAV